MRRISDEDQCVFRSIPSILLNESNLNRYFTLELLGKGGFSEVYKVCGLAASILCTVTSSMSLSPSIAHSSLSGVRYVRVPVRGLQASPA
jgi:hypothetical protein